ncbi:MAG: ATP-dependent Clp protease ATP-binding subunit, partial [Hyphomicrobiales bacterium]|nr:ATP-dependent Clp protease ATP-binding subunit [Hyphomicrobiales bacterium]
MGELKQLNNPRSNLTKLNKITPLTSLLDNNTRQKLLNLETEIKKNVIGQDHVLKDVIATLERGELGLNIDEKRPKPKGSFLFLGPTGVGKTELTLTFTHYLFGDESLYRLDMSEFMHFDSVKQFIGDETGNYGRLGNILENSNHGTLLFDEMEKAHPLIMDLFLQICDAARITLGNGKTYDLTNYYIVFTSNIGANRIPETGNIMSSTLERGIKAELLKNLRKEMIARFGAVIIFKQLGFDIQKEIARNLLDKEIERMKSRGCDLKYDELAFNYIIRNGIQEGLGVRPLRDT